MNFTEQFQGYEEPYPVGVLLPTIDIKKKEYTDLGLDESASNAEVLRAMCRQKVKD